MSDPLAQMCIDLARAHQALADTYALHAKHLASPGFRPQPPLAPSPDPQPAYAPPAAPHASPPAARPAGAAGTATGTVLRFGNATGADVAFAPTADLHWYRAALVKQCQKPEKEKYRQANERVIGVIDQELARRGPNG